MKRAAVRSSVAPIHGTLTPHVCRPSSPTLTETETALHLTPMPSPSALRTLQRRACAVRSTPGCKRYASHGHGPHYNEPTGYFLSEKVCVPRAPALNLFTKLAFCFHSPYLLGRSARRSLGRTCGISACTAPWA